MATSVKLHEMSGVVSDSGKEKYALNKSEEEEEGYTPGALLLFATEVLGTAMLLFLGCMGECVPKLVLMPVVPHFGGIGFGLTVLIVVQSIGHISGAHLNPQVTMAAVILGKIKPRLAPVYFVAEFVGASLGFGLLKLVSPSNYTGSLCDTMPHRDITLVQALVIETTITFILITVCGAIWDPRNADKTDSLPIRFGFIVACISIVAGSFTGASMNTARSFAPALINGNWDNHWIYFVGPTVGAVLGALVYKYILSAPKK